MTNCTITISSKSLNSINNFCYIFINYTNINFLLIKKTFQKKNNRKILTILKSPHVNKKSQEQFESLTFYKQFSITTTQIFKFIIFLKKLKLKVFPDIKIKINFKISNKKCNNLIGKTFNLNNYYLNFYKITINNNEFKILNNKKTKRNLKKIINERLLNVIKLLEMQK